MASLDDDLLEPSQRCPISEGRSPQETMESFATVVRYRRGQEIYRPEERADHWYRIVSGVARKCALLADGRRRIVDFLLPGDFFGLTARDVRSFAVEAILDGTVVACYPRRPLERLADSDPQLGRRVRELALEASSRLLAQILILGRTTALGKVSSFILEMAQRSSDGEAAEAVMLPMSRYDIADYLALSAETVSRSLTSLKRRAAIRLIGSHRVRIVDREALQDWSNDCRLD
jgi:CRP/FNR family transcriptional regulator, nitrogen fixation regulation protein